MIDYHPQETLLIRYADGVATPEEDQQVQLLLGRDSAAVEYLQQLAQTQGWLTRAAQIPPEPPPVVVSEFISEHTPVSNLQKSVWFQPVQRNQLVLIATLLVGLAGGSWLGWNAKPTAPAGLIASALPEPNPPEWVRLVADYHRLYARETISDGPIQLADDVSAELTAVLSRQLTVPQLTDLGLEFKRVQALAYDSQPLLQLAYLPDTARPVAICILASENAASDAIQSGMHGGMPYVFWQSEGHAVVVVGSLTQQQMDQVVAEVRRSLFAVS